MIQINNLINYKGMSFISLLITLMIFNGVFLAIDHWTTYQRKKAIQIYQRVQAIQIADNQKQRLLLGIPCESIFKQNKIIFIIKCQNNTIRITTKNLDITF